MLPIPRRVVVLARMTEHIFQILVSVVVGGLIGWEREFRTGVGIRTMMLVCLGSTLFTIYTCDFTKGEGDPRRIAAAVVSAIGFLGAGMILRHQRSIIGLTTAASVWLTAALGMGIAIGEYVMITVATCVMLAILWAIPVIRRLANARETLTYEIITPINVGKYDHLLELLENNTLRLTQENLSKDGDRMTCHWRVYGTHGNHKRVMVALLSDPEIDSCHIF